MRLRWDPVRDGISRGYSDPEGHELAQVAHVHSPSGIDRGWIVLLLHDQGELFDHYPTARAAQAAAEDALEALARGVDTDEVP